MKVTKLYSSKFQHTYQIQEKEQILILNTSKQANMVPSHTNVHDPI